ncbi:uncharacterized protein FA14DRAFT_160611 [Meira miltonrushii]|uniref:Uncharacterized protein n=1 Tax=Meira miltonrushii TaxID=1280837 RepID=A0A316VDT5_9BASI|nr:uncharacterized protein FA14DRAFT_160611 [Meira miltonrushii]PWN35484.1 hypothetical protein FA14DRAFT_160611 [Meira miltonrushii]
MATIGDYIFLIICLAIVGGIVYAVKGSSMNESIQKQRQSMKDKGFHISSDGLHVKTNRVKLTREEEVNKAQASWAKSGDVMKKHKDAFKFNAGTGYQEPDPKKK